MASSTRKVRTSGPDRVTGTILKGDVGADYPTYADGFAAFADALADYTDLGYVGEDGVTKSETTDFSRIQEMGGKTVARFLSDYNASFSATLLEFNEGVAGALYGEENVTVIGEDGTHGEVIIARAGTQTRPACPWVVRMVGRDDQRTMYSIPNGQLTSVGDVTHNRTSAAGHQITIETLPDDDGYDFYLFDDDGAVAVAAVPTITSILPAGESIGEHVTITGTRFMAGGVAIVTGASGVTVGGVNATDYTVVSKTQIVATIPAGTSGAEDVVVTNTTGASAATSYTVV